MATVSDNIKTPLGTFAFTKDFFTPRDAKRVDKKSGKPVFNYQLTILFDKDADTLGKSTTMRPLLNLVVDTAVAAWGDKAKDMLAKGIIKSPFLDGDGKQGMTNAGEEKAGHAGRWFIRCSSGIEHAPRAFEAYKDKNGALVPITDASGMQSGDMGFAVVNCYAWDNPENGKGISFGISLAQVTDRSGPRLGGGNNAKAEDFFEAIEGAEPTGGDLDNGASDMFG